MRKNFPNRTSRRGVATIEMAILAPLYIFMLLAVLFVGFLTLGSVREQEAAAFAAWSSGTQSPEELTERFFQWVAADKGGFDGGVGDDETQIEVTSDQVTQTDGYPVTDMEDIIAKLSLGEYYQRFSFTVGGGVQGSIDSHQTEFGRYLTDMGLGNMDGHRMAPRPANVTRMGEAFNGPGSERWMTEREATLVFRYKPWFLRFVINDQQDPFEDYLTGTPPEPSREPRLEEKFEVIGRGSLTRKGARESSAGQVFAEMADLGGCPQTLDAAAQPLDPAVLQQAITSQGFPATQSIYEPR